IAFGQAGVWATRWVRPSLRLRCRTSPQWQCCRSPTSAATPSRSSSPTGSLRSHHGAVALSLAVCHRPELVLHVQGASGRCETGRARTRRALCARRQRAQSRQSDPRHCTAGGSGTSNHVWAERYDRDLADIFAVQDEITEAVTIAIAPAIAEAEQQRAMRKPPGNLDSWAAYQRGLWHSSKATAEDNALGQRFFQQAIDLDPTFSAAYVGLAIAQAQAGDFQTLSRAETMSSTAALARRAVALDGADAEARSLLCGTLWARGDYEGALAEAERALAMTP